MGQKGISKQFEKKKLRKFEIQNSKGKGKNKEQQIN